MAHFTGMLFLITFLTLIREMFRYLYMRLKFFTFILLTFLGFLDSFPETVSRKEAEQIAMNFFNAVGKDSMSKPTLVYNGRNLTTDRLFPPFYVFNASTGGFVVISSDNKAFPILAYDKIEKFDINSLDSVSTSLLKRYAKEIEFIKYDPRIPYDAIEEWLDVDSGIDGILNKQPGKRFFREHATEFHDLLVYDGVSHEQEGRIMEVSPSTLFNQIESSETLKTRAAANLEEGLVDGSPVVKSMGGGHYEVTLSEEIAMVRLYNLQGSQVDAFKPDSGCVAYIKLDAMPNGFYFLLLNGKSGKPYGFKLLK